MNRYLSQYKVKIFKSKSIGLLYLLILPIFCSCMNGDDIPVKHNITTLSIRMNIEGKINQGTRVERTTIDDEWSFTDFTTGDKMGFYASGGNWLNEQSNVFNNQELIYQDNNIFTTPNGNGNFSPSDMKGNEVYMYYPYCSSMSDNGLELRVKEKPEDVYYKCIDYLSANNLTMEGMQNGTLTSMFGTFTHTFSELIIMRGEGFNNPPMNTNEIDYSRITVVINKGITNIKVNFDMENGWYCVPELVYDPDNSNKISSDNSFRWNAWKGGNYGITTEDSVGKEAWYVIVPTLGTSGNGRSMVEYIELYDNEGNLQRVTSLKLSGANTSNPTKYLDSGWRYPMEITMQELVPTVNPFPISRWDENIDLSDTREYGINDVTEFAKWVYDYNAYLSKPSDENEKKLLEYGDKIITPDTNEVNWKFYILSDINLEEYQPLTSEESSNSDERYIIPSLKNATLDGQSTILSGGIFLNYKISGLSKTFIGEMNNGQIQNLDFISPDIQNPASNETAGILVNRMTNSNVYNCNIDNGTLFNPNGPGGFIAGSISGGSVKDCTLKGSLVVSSTAGGNAAKIIGTLSDIDATFENNDVAGIVTEIN